MVRILIVGGILAVVFWVFSVVDCAAQPPTRHRGVSKTAWVLIVTLLPVIGGILWFTIGRRRGGDQGEQRLFAPDDDPEALRRMSTSEQDARIRRLEEELAALEDESDGPDPRS